MYYHIIKLDWHTKLLCFPFPKPGHLPLQYARNPHVRWLLHRFHGRDRRLETMSAPCWLDDLPYTEYTLLANCTSIQEWFEWCFSMFECVFSRLCLKCSNLKGSVCSTDFGLWGWDRALVFGRSKSRWSLCANWWCWSKCCKEGSL